MAKTRPICVRLDEAAHEKLKARAFELQGTPAGAARHLILSGLEGADSEGLARRLMGIERRLAASEVLIKDAVSSSSCLHPLLCPPIIPPCDIRVRPLKKDWTHETITVF